MSLQLIGILICLIGLPIVCYMGAGIILHPPKMSPLEVFPEQFGLKYEKALFKTRDGLTLSGWFLPSPKPGEERTILMCHGWGDNKGKLLESTHFLNANAGFNLFYFDFRSHGDSQGRTTTMGFYESIDFAAAVEFLKERKPWAIKRLGVFGISMGASVSAIAMPGYPEIKSAVLESPFPDYRRVVGRWAWNNFHVPRFPVVGLVLMFLKLRIGSDEVDKYNPIRFIGRIAPRPLLLMGGAQDDLMPESDVRELFGAAVEPKELWIVPGARHAKCHEQAGGEYERRVTAFFERTL